MLKMINIVWKLIQQFLDIAKPEHVWKWVGEEGSPRWSMSFWFDGFNFQAVLIPSHARPKSIGLFLNCPCSGSIDVGDGFHYLPAFMVETRIDELVSSGMTSANAKRTVRRELRNEMSLTDRYDAGEWSSYQMLVMAKRGRTVLATEWVEGLLVDPLTLMSGGELHVTEHALSLRTSLRDAALQELKGMSHSVINHSL